MKYIKKDNQFFFCSDRGELIPELVFDEMDTFGHAEYPAQENEEPRRFPRTGECSECGVMQQGKWGLINSRSGKWITPCTWEAVSGFCNGLARVKWCGKWGLINRNGIVVNYCRWDEIELFRDYSAVVRVKQDGKYGYYLQDAYNRYGEESVFRDMVFDDVDTFFDPDWYDWGSIGSYGGVFGDIGVRKDGKWGLVDMVRNRWITPCQWEAVGCFRNNAIAKVKQNGKWGFVDRSGALVRPCQWDEIDRYDCFSKAIRVRQGDKYGYLDKVGGDLLGCEYDAVGEYDAACTLVKQAGKWYAVEHGCRRDISERKTEKLVFHHGLAKIYDCQGYGLMDETGHERLSCGWDAVERVPPNLNGFKWRKDPDIYDWSGKTQFPAKLIRVKKNGKWGLYDLDGRECYPCTLDKIWRFEQGVAKICENRKWGLIDEEGHIVTPCKWEYVYRFRGDTAAVRLDGKWGSIDRSGELVEPCTRDIGI